MAKTTALEERLEAITREFLGKIVETIRNASFAEVAGYAPAQGQDRAADRGSERARRPVTRVVATPTRERRDRDETAAGGRRPRQTAGGRAELSERLVEALRNASEPLGIRALSSELAVAPDLLAAPLRALRDAGRIAKHGDKRNTTYSVA